MAYFNPMIIASLSLIIGWALGLTLLSGLALLTARLHLSPRLYRLFYRLFTHGACCGLIGALWLSSALHRLPLAPTLLLSGFLVTPFCILPVLYKLAGKMDGLTRAAAGLGAGPHERARLLWLPLLRGPILLTSLLSVAALLTCLALSGGAHG